MNAPKPEHDHDEDKVRHHVFDGIQEYDRRLPNWWLLTFYGAIVFSIFYWLEYQRFPRGHETASLEAELSRIEAAKLSASASLDDPSLWKMSRNPVFIDAGRATYLNNCASCHLASLKGKAESPAAVGPSLADSEWLHGGRPLEINHTVNDGIAAKGMPAWGPVLGQKRITEVVAFILSHHPAPPGAE